MATAKTLVTRARVEGLVITLVALGYLWEIRAIPAFYQTPGVPGPAAFPEVLGLVLGASGLWRMFWGAPVDDQDDDSAADDGAAQPTGSGAGGAVTRWLAAHGKFLGLWVVLLGYFVFMPELGFPLASAIALAAMGFLLGEKRWPVLGAGSVVVTAILHVAFVYGLGVRLPLGVLSLLGK